MRSFWFNGGSIAARNGVPVLCSDCPCPSEEPSSSSSSSSSSEFTPGIPCVDCTTGTTPAVLKLTVPRVERWVGGILNAVLLAGTYELRQDPNHPCCYAIQTSAGYSLYCSIGGVSIDACWESGTNLCTPHFIFWKAGWRRTLDGVLHDCTQIAGSLPEFQSFGVKPERPGPITVAI